MNILKHLWLVGLATVTPVSYSQIGGGGPGGTQTPKDSNPYNPANWEVLPATGTMTITKTSHFLRNGQVETETTVEDGLNSGGASATNVWATNTSCEHRKAKSVLSASYNIRWQWVGIGPAPISVWVRKQAEAFGSVGPDGTISVSNGMGGQPYELQEGNHKEKRARSNKLKLLTVSGGQIEENFSASVVAESDNTVPAYSNSAYANFSGYFILKGMEITPGIGPTYIRNSQGQRVMAPAKHTYTIGEAMQGGPSTGGNNITGWGLTVSYERLLYGPWVDVFHSWNGGGTNVWIDTLFTEYETVSVTHKYAASDVKAIPTGGPKKEIMKLTIKDVGGEEDQTSIEDEHTLFINAPVMYPEVIGMRPKQYLPVPDFTVDSPGYSAACGSVPCHWKTPHVIWDVFGFLSSTADIAGAFTQNPWITGITAVSGFIVENWEPKPADGGSAWAWGAMFPDSTYNGSSTPPVVTVWAGWRMYPSLKEARQDRLYRGQKYGKDGYTSMVESPANVRLVGDLDWSGRFTDEPIGVIGGPF